MNPSSTSNPLAHESLFHDHIFCLLKLHNTRHHGHVWSTNEVDRFASHLLTYLKLTCLDGQSRPRDISIVTLNVELKRVLLLLHVGEVGARVIINMPCQEEGTLGALKKAVDWDLEKWYARDRPVEHPAAQGLNVDSDEPKKSSQDPYERKENENKSETKSETKGRAEGQHEDESPLAARPTSAESALSSAEARAASDRDTKADAAPEALGFRMEKCVICGYYDYLSQNLSSCDNRACRKLFHQKCAGGTDKNGHSLCLVCQEKPKNEIESFHEYCQKGLQRRREKIAKLNAELPAHLMVTAITAPTNTTFETPPSAENDDNADGQEDQTPVTPYLRTLRCGTCTQHIDPNDMAYCDNDACEQNLWSHRTCLVASTEDNVWLCAECAEKPKDELELHTRRVRRLRQERPEMGGRV